MSKKTKAPVAKPFLKWAGGKRKMAEQVLGMMPDEIPIYIEPFLGGGAIFFALAAAGRLVGDVVLADRNEALVEAWQMVRDAPGAVIRHFGRWQNTAECYYEVRDQLVPEGPVERAARLIWLNRHCFNGLYRLNRSGGFNVSFGKYKAPKVDEDNLLLVSQALQGARIIAGDFETVVEQHVGPGAVVEVDPPYIPRSTTSSFTTYDGHPFDMADQRRVAALARRLSARGDVVGIFHNSHTPETIEVWGLEEARTDDASGVIHYQGTGGILGQTIEARRNINRNAKGRGPVKELIMTLDPLPM